MQVLITSICSMNTTSQTSVPFTDSCSPFIIHCFSLLPSPIFTDRYCTVFQNL